MVGLQIICQDVSPVFYANVTEVISFAGEKIVISIYGKVVTRLINYITRYL